MEEGTEKDEDLQAPAGKSGGENLGVGAEGGEGDRMSLLTSNLEVGVGALAVRVY